MRDCNIRSYSSSSILYEVSHIRVLVDFFFWIIRVLVVLTSSVERLVPGAAPNRLQNHRYGGLSRA